MALPNPETRQETFLAAAAGESVTLPDPVTRKEAFLAKAAGMSVAEIEPVTREEMYLNAITGGGGGGWTPAVQSALLNLMQHVAYTDEQGQTYYDALVAALGGRTLSSISAVFTQGQAVIYDTDSLDTLKQYLVVTATFSDSTTETVTAYTLSGTLTAGTSTITVEYSGKSDSFTVNVTTAALWEFTNGYTCVQGTAGLAGRTYRKAVSARACGHDPIANNNYVFTVTDSALYNLAVYGIDNLTKASTSSSDVVDGYTYKSSGDAPSWSASGSIAAPYVWLALKKMDGTAFTAEELANGAEAIFTYTEGT